MTNKKETSAGSAEVTDKSFHAVNDTTKQAEKTGSDVDKTVKELLTASEAELNTRLNILAVVKQFPIRSEFNSISKALANKYQVKIKDVIDLWKETFDTGNSANTKSRQAQKFEVDIDPCKEDVTPGFVFNELLETLKEHIVFQDCDVKDAQAVTCSLWILANWCIDSFDFSPYLMITAPEKRCGKSQLLNLLANLSKRPLEGGNFTAPVLFRLVEKHKPTIFIDEVDSFLKKDDDLQGIIKCGIERGKALAWRMEKQADGNFEPVGFDTFAFKAFSGISAQSISDTITDRCIKITLKRKLTDEIMPKVREKSPDFWTKLCSHCARVAKDHKDWLRTHKAKIPPTINDREADKWEPLFKIADLIDHVDDPGRDPDELGGVGKITRRIAEIISNDDPDMPISIELLANIKTIIDRFDDWRLKEGYVLTSELLELLANNDEWRWATYSYGKSIDARQLSKRLRPFGIRPTRIDREEKRGYLLDQFEDPFIRYLDNKEDDQEQGE